MQLFVATHSSCSCNDRIGLLNLGWNLKPYFELCSYFCLNICSMHKTCHLFAQVIVFIPLLSVK